MEARLRRDTVEWVDIPGGWLYDWENMSGFRKVGIMNALGTAADGFFWYVVLFSFMEMDMREELCRLFGYTWKVG